MRRRRTCLSEMPLSKRFAPCPLTNNGDFWIMLIDVPNLPDRFVCATAVALAVPFGDPRWQDPHGTNSDDLVRPAPGLRSQHPHVDNIAGLSQAEHLHQ